MPGRCLDENAALAFLDGLLSDDEEGGLEAHIDACADCLALVAGLARGAEPRSAAPAPERSASTLGRYVLLDLIGVGAMGAVYAAYDPELERKIALKLVRGGPGTSGERLLEEARALAHLSHPNVVAIFDVGRFDGGLFLAMELVEGVTLRAWLRERRRSWQEVVRAFADAGRGLGAAHARGLVHRDFKPDNVLVGDDGRVVVTDFGLALRRAEEGAIAGTPAYMAPELQRAEPADARTDQFAYCVAVYEALYERRPGPAPGAARTGRVPARVAQAIKRGLSEAREDRHPSMESLVSELTRAPRVTPRRVGLAVAGTLVLGATAALACRPEIEQRRSCAKLDEGIGAAWSTERRGAVQTALVAANRPEEWDRVARAVDRYVTGWRAMRAEVCAPVARADAARVVREGCLDERAAELATLTGVLSHADARAAENATGAVLALTRVERCADLKWIAANASSAPRATAKDVRGELALAKVLGDTGKYAEGAAVATRVAERARERGDRAAEATALYRQADLTMSGGEVRAAKDLLARAGAAADAAGDDRTRAQALAELVFIEGYLLHDRDGALAADARLSALLERIGGDDDVEMHRMQALGLARLASRELDLAEPALARAAELGARVYGPQSREVAMTWNSLGLVADARGDLDRAHDLFERALASWTSLLGPDHPDLALPLNNLGMVAERRAETDAALGYYGAALAIAERALGPEHPSVAVILENIGDVHAARGEPTQALPVLARVLAIREKALGGNDAETTATRVALSRVYAALRDWQRGRELAERALAALGDTADAHTRARATFALAVASWADGRASDARTRARALASAALEMHRAAADAADARAVERWLEDHGGGAGAGAGAGTGAGVGDGSGG